jgi:hypothetical protein
VRDGDVGARLYQMSLQKQQKMAELRAAQQRLADDVRAATPAAAALLRAGSRRPLQMARTHSAPAARPVEDELLRRGEEAEMRRELERRRLEGASGCGGRGQRAC